MRFSARCAGVAALLLVGAARSATGQELHGVVRDSASRRPVSGAVITVLDSANVSLGRHITNERGEYRIALSDVGRRVRAVRLGYRPTALAIAAGTTQLDLVLTAIPALLQTVTVSAASNCPKRDDATRALALLEQARAGLLSTIVARESNPATMSLVEFERIMDGNSERIERQSVRVTSSAGRTQSFQAAMTGAVFVRDGFAHENEVGTVYFGPDAGVLLDDDFVRAYCFRIQDPERERRDQVGLRFYRADGARGRVDVDGTLWIDTIARALRDIDYRFVGVERPRGAPEPGGYVSFHEMPNGMVLIDRWGLRLMGANVDTMGRARTAPRVTYYARDVGGETARATWPDGSAWTAKLGTLLLHVVDRDGQPAFGVVLKLEDTDYRATPDAHGMVEIPDLLPGPYTVLFVDSSGAALPAGLTFVAARDSVFQGTVVAPPAEQFRIHHDQ
jgi:hypothetical protein